MHKSICIIPARGGSKRIPRKNIKKFRGKPIIAYSIETALKSCLFDEVIVSTDCEEIKKVSLKYGANVPFIRSNSNSGDHAPIVDVMDEVLKSFKSTYVCCLFPAAPLVNSKMLTEAFNLLLSSGFDSVRPVVKYSHPIKRAMKLSKDSGVEWLFPESATLRTQDTEVFYHDAGQFYWFKNINGGLRSDKRGAIIVSESEVQDIDDMNDWHLAELKFKR